MLFPDVKEVSLWSVNEVFRKTLVGDSGCVVLSAVALNSVEGHRLSRHGIVGQNWAVPKPGKLCRLKRRILDCDAARQA